MAMPRARTQTGRNSCSSAINVEITVVQANPANDLWVTDGGAVIPALRQVVRDVDLDRRVVTVHELPGLLDEA